MKLEEVQLTRQQLEFILGYFRENHPREALLILSGKRKGRTAQVEDIYIPPFAVHGPTYAQFSVFHLPPIRVIGTAHSHPSGACKPSTQDLNSAIGLVILISTPPYTPASTCAYTHSGEKLKISVR
ncbi:MAG: peptidase [Thermoproteota archaeon]|nr:MAG: peptidase [Candidatus Korarchaeota archaeon]